MKCNEIEKKKYIYILKILYVEKNISDTLVNLKLSWGKKHVHQRIGPRRRQGNTNESGLLTKQIWLKLASDSHTFGVIIARNEK